MHGGKNILLSGTAVEEHENISVWYIDDSYNGILTVKMCYRYTVEVNGIYSTGITQ